MKLYVHNSCKDSSLKRDNKMNKTIRIVQGGFAAIFGLTIISVIIRGIKENIPIWAEI